MCRPAVDSHNPSDSTQYSNSDANPRSRNSCRSSSSAKYARNSAVIWLRRRAMLESPAKSSSSAKDFKRYSCCPISLVYHGLFRPRKNANGVSFRLKISYDSTRLIIARSSTIQAPPHAHLRAARVHCQPIPKFLSSKFGGRRLATTKYRGRFRGVRLATLYRNICLHARADSTKAYAHAAGLQLTGHSNAPSAAASEPPAATRRAQSSPVVLRPTFLFAALLREAATLDVESAHAVEQCLPPLLAHRAGRRPVLGKPSTSTHGVPNPRC